ncbi:MFS transporter [Phenylobacterium deserti]|uniref:MFS transporter n=1 Tax=Phenylobacterium deserti TaxID=1914756 RepID=A0A328ASX2_9CAUL|nr:MFS transporter [Phenylobacterium deserti]RAK58202.1 MFS transporter [Phenylobacterium deserti]
MSTPPEAAGGLPKRSFAILFGVSLAMAIGNTGLLSVLPAISRSIGIPDYLAAAVFSLSALLWAITSPLWAKASDRRGRKPLIVVGLGGYMVSMIACALVVSAGLWKLAAPLVIFGLFLMARAIFGGFGSAANPVSQAYIAERTAPEQRTQAMSSLAGAFGLGTVLGPFLAPLFILPFVGLAGPMFVFALIAAGMLVVVLRYLPESPVTAQAPGSSATSRGRAMWRDPRVRPFLLYGLVVATCQTAQTQTLGFLIIDKLGVSPMRAQGFIAVAMMFGAMAGLLAQWGIIRMFEMTPRQLLRWGAVVAALGNLVVALSPSYWTVVCGFAIASMGFGFARPGFTAGASLAVGLGEQARVAGAIAAVNGINVVLAPASVWLYGQVQPAPFYLNLVLMLSMLVFAFANRQLRNADPKPAGPEVSAMAGLEKGDETGGL